MQSYHSLLSLLLPSSRHVSLFTKLLNSSSLPKILISPNFSSSPSSSSSSAPYMHPLARISTLRTSSQTRMITSPLARLPSITPGETQTLLSLTCVSIFFKFEYASNSFLAIENVDIIAITLGLASVGATVVGNIIAYHSLKTLKSKSKSTHESHAILKTCANLFITFCRSISSTSCSLPSRPLSLSLHKRLRTNLSPL